MSHVKQSVNYKGGKIYGYAQNSEGLHPAKSVQAFMLTSKSSFKEIVALHPVSGLNRQNLVNMIMKVMTEMHKIGFKIVSLISDNNRVNRKAFEIICEGKLKPYIINPFDPNFKLFFFI